MTDPEHSASPNRDEHLAQAFEAQLKGDARKKAKKGKKGKKDEKDKEKTPDFLRDPERCMGFPRRCPPKGPRGGACPRSPS